MGKAYGITARTKRVHVVMHEGNEYEFDTREAAEAWVTDQQIKTRARYEALVRAEEKRLEAVHRDGYFGLMQGYMDAEGKGWTRADCYDITKTHFPDIAKYFGWAVRRLKAK